MRHFHMSEKEKEQSQTFSSHLLETLKYRWDKSNKSLSNLVFHDCVCHRSCWAWQHGNTWVSMSAGHLVWKMVVSVSNANKLVSLWILSFLFHFNLQVLWTGRQFHCVYLWVSSCSSCNIQRQNLRFCITIQSFSEDFFSSGTSQSTFAVL